VNKHDDGQYDRGHDQSFDKAPIDANLLQSGHRIDSGQYQYSRWSSGHFANDITSMTRRGNDAYKKHRDDREGLSTEESNKTKRK